MRAKVNPFILWSGTALYLLTVLVFLPCTAYAAGVDLKTPSITSIGMEQAYKVCMADGATITESGKVFGKGQKPYAGWTNSNVVEVRFKGSALYCPDLPNYRVDYLLQRSTNPSSGFKTVGGNDSGFVATRITYNHARGSMEEERCSFADWGNGNFSLIDATAGRGNKYYYRIYVKCTYYDESRGTEASAERLSSVVSVRTTPKTLATSFKVKSPKGWKAKARVQTRNVKKLKKMAHTYKISWKKRSDVSGYFVYKIKIKAVKRKERKIWQYAETGYSEGVSTGNRIREGDYASSVTAQKYCKKIKTLKASATSFTFKIKDKDARRYLQHTAYVVVPYVKQNGKTYVGDAKKAYYVYCSMYGFRNQAVSTMSKPYEQYVPFVLPT